MEKDEIFKKLDSLNIDKDKYIVIDDTSVFIQGVIDEASNIYLSVDSNYTAEFNNLDTCFNVCLDYFNLDDSIVINGYRFLNLEKCLEIKKSLNLKKDKKIIEKIDYYLCTLDNYRYEKKLRSTGIKLIAGVDEVGRGPLVGPVVAACVILPEDFNLDGLTDSKKLSEKKRDMFYDLIMEQAISVGVGIMSEKVIDDVNIYEATKLAMKQAIDNLDIKPEHILIDAMPLSLDIPTTSIIKGDFKSITISAASVIAKVTRDRMLYELDSKYPMYDFKENKGYPTKKHLEAISKYGIIDEHRRSYGPVADYIKNHKK